MQLRPPRFRLVSAALGLFVGSAVAISLPWLWPAPPANAVEIGVLVTLLGWVAVEQFSEELDRAVNARLHRSLSVVGLLPAAGIVVVRVFTDETISRGIALRTFAFAFVALFATACCSARYAQLRLQTGSVRGSVIAVKSRLYELPIAVGSSVVGLVVVKLVLDNAFSFELLSGSVIGSVIGVVLGSVLVGTRNVELIALDDGLFVTAEKRAGGRLIPWRRISEVNLDDGTLTVTRGLPWPMKYEADISSAVHPDTAADAFRSLSRNH